ncbi:MAG: phospholipid carrier-dependent glycosyltransferase [Patescibacteria group bacterium]
MFPHMKSTTKWYLIVLLILSALTHFIFFGRPNEVVFDEVHFGNFSSAYDTGKYFFDIHPPLGKLLISVAGYLGGYEATTTNYATIGNKFTDPHYVWYRILPMLAGWLFPLIIFLLCLRLRLSPLASFLAGLFIILENSLLIQSRFIFLDSFLLLFGFLALLFYLYHRQVESRPTTLFYLILSAIFAALAFSIKWTGLSFLGLIFLIEIWDVVRFRSWPALKEATAKIIAFLAIGFFIYLAVFAIHFALLPKSGPGDAFMTPAFQKTLAGSRYESDAKTKPISLLPKFWELNKEMYVANKTLTATHPYSSQWYTWPFLVRPIYYWVQTAKTASGMPLVESKIYLLGNPFIYWLSDLAVMFMLVYLILLFKNIKNLKNNYRLPVFLIIGYLANWLPFIFIGRVMFLYHYLTALVFAIITLAFVIDQIKVPKVKIAVGLLVVIIFSISFIFFSPLTYGLPMSVAEQNTHFWFNSWR